MTEEEIFYRKLLEVVELLSNQYSNEIEDMETKEKFEEIFKIAHLGSGCPDCCTDEALDLFETSYNNMSQFGLVGNVLDDLEDEEESKKFMELPKIENV